MDGKSAFNHRPSAVINGTALTSRARAVWLQPFSLDWLILSAWLACLAQRKGRKICLQKIRAARLFRYFRVPDGRLNAFKELCQQFVGKASGEPKCLYYGFSFCGNEAHCREGYADAEGAPGASGERRTTARRSAQDGRTHPTGDPRSERGVGKASRTFWRN